MTRYGNYRKNGTLDERIKIKAIETIIYEKYSLKKICRTNSIRNECAQLVRNLFLLEVNEFNKNNSSSIVKKLSAHSYTHSRNKFTTMRSGRQRKLL